MKVGSQMRSMVVGLLTLLLAFLFAEQYQGSEKFENEIR
jgi:hypothetical protein